MRLNFVLGLILSIIVASFAIVNSKVVAINLLFTTVSVSQALVIFISVAIGAIIALLFGLVKEFKLKRELKGKKQEVNELKKEKEDWNQQEEELAESIEEESIKKDKKQNLIEDKENSQNNK